MTVVSGECCNHEADEKYVLQIQGGAEPTDTFQMVIDNILKKGKICETVYKYDPFHIVNKRP